jgi:hypothetical protein
MKTVYLVGIKWKRKFLKRLDNTDKKESFE